jgi:hypothetical protein
MRSTEASADIEKNRKAVRAAEDRRFEALERVRRERVRDKLVFIRRGPSGLLLD